MHKPALISGTAMGALAVVLGAFGAHALKSLLQPDQLAIFETAVRYQFYHCFALLAAGICYPSFPGKLLKRATIFFFSGIILFSGSLYAMVFLSIKGVQLGPVGVITPLGGLCLIIGWIFFLIGIVKK